MTSYREIKTYITLQQVYNRRNASLCDFNVAWMS